MRKSGILLPIASLPSSYGIGCFDQEAYRFIDHLKKAGQSYWQILPLGPTGYGDSPYQSFSTFAGNPYFISLDELVTLGWLTKEELPEKNIHEKEVDYLYLYETRFSLLYKAYERSDIEHDKNFQNYCEKESSWLEDYSLFMAIKDSLEGKSWEYWPDDLRLRKEDALKKQRKELEQKVKFYQFIQYLFWTQWRRVKTYANKNGIEIIGDIPIYVAYDSADTWANPNLFQLDIERRPEAVAGVPPDGFSADGQLWGNPLYRWEEHQKTGYQWWIERIRYCTEIYDVVRIDHFRGFDEYYSIPYGDKNARRGRWEKGPGYALFEEIKNHLGNLNIIAEDLGYLTDSVKKLVTKCGFPGMKILEFAFDSRDSSGANDYLPHNYDKNCVVYTGTHDNETMMGWFSSIQPEEKETFKKYLCTNANDDKLLLRKSIALAMQSVADWCILPIQDWLGLDNHARINTPSTLGGNWKWRLTKEQFTKELEEEIASYTRLYGRSKLEKENESMETQLNNLLQIKFQKNIEECSYEEIYAGLMMLVKALGREKQEISGERKLYYISAEFLIGKLLSNNLINLGLYDEVESLLDKHGIKLSDIEEIELEPSLGNGGLGRLAACFLDSIATLGLQGDGVGLNYHFGLFEQKFRNNKQCEEKNVWLKGETWLNDTGIGFDVQFKGFNVHSKLYDIDIIGYENGKNKLHLFDLEGIDESLVTDGISFDQKNICKNLTLFLYPDDSTKEGQVLRIYQQYFMVSNAAQLILLEEKQKGHDLRKLHEHVCIQINDTHPSMVIPELIYRLMQEGIHMKEAIDIVSHTCAYTNHTILAEALEKWPYDDLKEVIPHLMPIIEALDMNASLRSQNPATAIIDTDNRVHMAHMDIHYGYSVNGVASLHTEILKESELKPFYELYPEKFNNKTNGITFRRWLLHCNNDLTNLITELIGDGFKKDAKELEKLLAFVEDEKVLHRLLDIKTKNKEELCRYLERTQGITVHSDSIFDIQIKRLHEYKRQQMNLLYIIWLIQKIRKGYKPKTRITFIFGAKAAPAYTIAKDIIHAILCVQELVENDEELSKYIQVVMVENYNVTKAEKLIPACDISEQISLASKEASGTGNMKFMLNGAITLGTEDGANVEIHELVGNENIYVFGESSEAVIRHYENHDYVSKTYYENDEEIKEAVDFLVSKELVAYGDEENLTRLYNELINKDWFMTLLDFKSYIQMKTQAFEDYEDRMHWAKMSLCNIAHAGYFSSDRTIMEYNEDIWKLK